MAEFSAVSEQIINPGESAVFVTNPVPCRKGLIWWRAGTGAFSLSGGPNRRNRCCFCPPCTTNYLALFGANIAVPTGETVGPISVAFTIDGVTLQESQMEVTPAAVEEYFSVSTADNVAVRCGCCQTFSVRNTSTIPISMRNANLILTK